jgi:thioredoxin reductase (NADPH)
LGRTSRAARSYHLAGTAELFRSSTPAKAGLREFLKVHNYPGFFGIGGEELLRRLTAQAKQYDAQLVGGRVTSLRREGPAFVAFLQNRNVAARFVLLATGLIDCSPPMEGEPKNGRSEAIRFCPVCDGYETIDRRVGVLGDIEADGKKATFSAYIHKGRLAFLTDEAAADVNARKKLDEEGVKLWAGRTELSSSQNPPLSL